MNSTPQSLSSTKRSGFCEDFEADFARHKQLKPSESYFHDAEQTDGDSEIWFDLNGLNLFFEVCFHLIQVHHKPLHPYISSAWFHIG